jgi:methyl halide transferase
MSNSTDQQEIRSRLKAHFEEAKGTTEHGSKWNELWKEGFVPWDKGVPSPALVDLLIERQDLFPPISSRRRKALVPGCGRGYDVLLLSAFGYDAYGLEISSNALVEARKVEKEMAGKGVYETRSGVTAGKITWLAGDFFKDDFLKDVDGDGKFDFFYDYTVRSSLSIVSH